MPAASLGRAVEAHAAVQRMHQLLAQPQPHPQPAVTLIAHTLTITCALGGREFAALQHASVTRQTGVCV